MFNKSWLPSQKMACLPCGNVNHQVQYYEIKLKNFFFSRDHESLFRLLRGVCCSKMREIRWHWSRPEGLATSVPALFRVCRTRMVLGGRMETDKDRTCFLWRFFFMPCQYSFLLPSLLAKIEEINCRHLFGIGFLPLEHPHLGVGAGWIFTILGDCGGIWEAVFLPSVKKLS